MLGPRSTTVNNKGTSEKNTKKYNRKNNKRSERILAHRNVPRNRKIKRKNEVLTFF